MLVNKTIVSIESIELFHNYDEVNSIFIVVGFVNKVYCLWKGIYYLQLLLYGIASISCVIVFYIKGGET